MFTTLFNVNKQDNNVHTISVHSASLTIRLMSSMGWMSYLWAFLSSDATPATLGMRQMLRRKFFSHQKKKTSDASKTGSLREKRWWWAMTACSGFENVHRKETGTCKTYTKHEYVN